MCKCIYTLHKYLLYIIYCRVVKLSSPNLNFALVAGVTLLYVSVFFYLYSPTSIGQASATIQTILCNVSIQPKFLHAKNFIVLTSIVTSVAVFNRLHTVLVCGTCQDMENLLHICQSFANKNGNWKSFGLMMSCFDM